MSETPSGRPRRGDAVAPNALRRFGPRAVCRVPPTPTPTPGREGGNPGASATAHPAPSSVPPSGNASVLPPPGGTGSGPYYHLQSPRLQQIWCGNLQDLERLKNPSFALSAGPKLAEISRLPTPWRGTQEGKIPLPDPLGFSCPGASLASKGRSPAWEGLAGATVLFLGSAAETRAGPDLLGFPEKWGMLPQTGSAFKTP